MDRKKQILPAALLMAAAFILRFFSLGYKSLNMDEAVSWLLSVQTPSALIPFMAAAGEAHPPLYFLLSHFWLKCVPSAEWLLRLPSVLCSVLSLAVLWLLAKRLFDEKTALIALALGCLSSFHLAAAQEFRMYAFLGLLCGLSFLLLLRYMDEGRYPFALTAVNIAGLYTHYYFLFVPLTQLILILLHRKADRRCAVQGTIQAAAAAPWLIYAAFFFRKETLLIRETPDLWHLFMLFSQLGGANYQKGAFLSGGASPWCEPLLLIGLILITVIALVLKKEEGLKKSFLLWPIAVPLFCALLISHFTAIKIFEFKYFIIILPFVLIAAGRFALQYKTGFLLAALLLCLNGSSLYNCYFSPAFQGQNWREAENLLIRRGWGGDNVILASPSMAAVPLAFYGGRTLSVLPIDLRPGQSLGKEWIRAFSEYGGLALCCLPGHPMGLVLKEELDGLYIREEEILLGAESALPSDKILIVFYRQ